VLLLSVTAVGDCFLERLPQQLLPLLLLTAPVGRYCLQLLVHLLVAAAAAAASEHRQWFLLSI